MPMHFRLGENLHQIITITRCAASVRPGEVIILSTSNPVPYVCTHHDLLSNNQWCAHFINLQVFTKWEVDGNQQVHVITTEREYNMTLASEEVYQDYLESAEHLQTSST